MSMYLTETSCWCWWVFVFCSDLDTIQNINNNKKKKFKGRAEWLTAALVCSARNLSVSVKVIFECDQDVKYNNINVHLRKQIIIAK